MEWQRICWIERERKFQEKTLSKLYIAILCRSHSRSFKSIFGVLKYAFWKYLGPAENVCFYREEMRRVFQVTFLTAFPEENKSRSDSARFSTSPRRWSLFVAANYEAAFLPERKLLPIGLKGIRHLQQETRCSK